jgi:hypothetical protein
MEFETIELKEIGLEKQERKPQSSPVSDAERIAEFDKWLVAFFSRKRCAGWFLDFF